MVSDEVSINERIRVIKDRFFSTNAEFAARLDKNPQFISNIMRKGYNVGPKTLRDILDIVPEVNEEWLFTGNETMIKANESLRQEFQANRNGIRYYELSDNMYTIEVPFISKNDYKYFHKECLNSKNSKFLKLKRGFFISSSISNCYYAGFEIHDSAMQSPDGKGVCYGDMVFGREIDLERLPYAIFTTFSPYWMIVHTNGVVIRSIDFSNIDQGKLLCYGLSGKLDHPDITVQMKDVVKLYNIERKNISVR